MIAPAHQARPGSAVVPGDGSASFADELTVAACCLSRLLRRSQRIKGSPAAKRIVAKRIKKGTMAATVLDRVINKRRAPTSTPATDDGASHSKKRRLSRRSRR